jgi:hypothetical protein
MIELPSPERGVVDLHAFLVPGERAGQQTLSSLGVELCVKVPDVARSAADCYPILLPGLAGHRRPHSAGALKVASGLGVVVRTLAPGSVTSSNRQPPESGVVHDHIRLGEHQIVAIACNIVIIGTRHVKHSGPTPANKTVRRASGRVSSARVGARPR